MGKKRSGKVINKDDEFEVDSAEFELIKEFLNFTRCRERGKFVANIITHNNRRYVLIDLADKKRIDLQPIDKKEENGKEDQG